MKKRIADNIKNRIEEIKEKYNYEFLGIRVQEAEFVDGQILDNSFVWVDGEPTDEELDGTCALTLDDADLIQDYFGEHVAIIGGWFGEYGQDEGEIIIRDAKVLEVIA